MFDIVPLSSVCAAIIQLHTMTALVKVESGGNPYAIGIVNGRLQRQPKTLEEAVATADALERDGWDFSLGLSQVNIKNVKKAGFSNKDAFDPCNNLHLGASLLKDCQRRAELSGKNNEAAYEAALSCYYSGNFHTGFHLEKDGTSYVQRVLAADTGSPGGAFVIPVIPADRVDPTVAGRSGGRSHSEDGSSLSSKVPASVAGAPVGGASGGTGSVVETSNQNPKVVF